MAMTQGQFDALVRRLEDDAERNPSLYKLKLGAFASLGYLYIAGILAALLAAVGTLAYFVIAGGSGGTALVKVAIPVIVLIGIVAKALWVKLEEPQGMELKPSERPRLFALIEEVRKAAKAPGADVVLLTNELNAAIVQVPRLGLLGWQKNFLILGLPLMQLLSLDEFKAVLAHEFGHLSGAHGRFGAWIYRVRAGWARLHEQLQQEDHWGSFLFVPFFNWFAPNFAAWSFVQARNQEYEADRVAAESVGAQALTNALIRLDLKARELDQDFWPAIFSRAAVEATPSATPFTTLMQSERRGFLPAADEHLKQALTRQTDTADTHPCLSERIAAIRQPARLPARPEQSAAETIFGGALRFLAEHFDTEWRRAVDRWWTERHAEIKSGHQELSACRAKPITGMSDDELFRFAQLAEELESPEAAYPLYLTLAKRESKPVGARFAVGRLLLRKGEERGKGVIDRIMAERPDAVMPGCEIIVPYLQAQGRVDEAKAYTDRYWRARNAAAAADQDRYTLRASDDYAAASGLAEESLARLTAALTAHRRVKRAYLAQKVLPKGQAPLYVVGVEPKHDRSSAGSRQADQELVQELANTIVIAEDLLFVPLNENNNKFQKVLRKIAGAQLCDDGGKAKSQSAA